MKYGAELYTPSKKTHLDYKGTEINLSISSLLNQVIRNDSIVNYSISGLSFRFVTLKSPLSLISIGAAFQADDVKGSL